MRFALCQIFAYGGLVSFVNGAAFVTKHSRSINSSLDASTAATSPISDSEESSLPLMLSRAQEICSVAFDHAVPLLGSAFSQSMPKLEGESDVEAGSKEEELKKVYNYWLATTPRWEKDEEISNADRAVLALKRLCPTYVKFGGAVAAAADAPQRILPKEFANSLFTSNDANEEVFAFDTEKAKQIIEQELLSLNVPEINIAILLDTLSPDPIATTAVDAGQIYQAYLPDVGTVAVKVQNSDVKEMVKKDAELLKSMAAFVNRFMSVNVSSDSNNGKVGTLVDAVDEFTNSIYHELDYSNPNHASSLGTEVIGELCTEFMVISRLPEESEMPEEEDLVMMQQGGSWSFRTLFRAVCAGGQLPKKKHIGAAVSRVLSLGQLELSFD